MRVNPFVYIKNRFYLDTKCQFVIYNRHLPRQDANMPN
jgi:hypothetical protein